MKSLLSLLVLVLFAAPCYGQLADLSASRYDTNSLSNPYGAGSRYKLDGLLNPYSQYGSRYSNDSWTNPYATNPPKIYGSDGTYYGRLSVNRYAPDSTSSSYGRSTSSFRYSARPIYVYPGR